ncbi:MAG: PEGA domain-containing protein [Treponema sp.]|nr:PEGA domain-containing protein [Treponema sp.]
MKEAVSVLMITLILAGCQTTTQVNINTNVPDALVVVDGKIIGNTPIQQVTIKNSSGRSYPVVIQKEGYEVFRGVLATETKPAAAAAVGVGYIFWWLLLPMLLYVNALWMEGPLPDQYFVLKEAAPAPIPAQNPAQ